MSQADTEVLLEKWRERIGELEEEAQRIEGRQDPMLKAEWDHVRERVAPDLSGKILQYCIEDIETCSSTDELLAAMAKWRREADERNTGIREMSTNEFFRADRERFRFEKCIEELAEILPDEIFPECNLCSVLKEPIRDERYNKGFRWKCPKCNF